MTLANGSISNTIPLLKFVRLANNAIHVVEQSITKSNINLESYIAMP